MALGLIAAPAAKGAEAKLLVAEGAEHTYTQIASTNLHLCALRDDGSAVCWGHASQKRRCILTPPDGAFVQIDTGVYGGCGVRADGSVDCWGARLKRSGGLACVTHDAKKQGWLATQPNEGPYVRVKVGVREVCALTEDGELHCPAMRARADSGVAELDVENAQVCILNGEGQPICMGHDVSYRAPPVARLHGIDVGGWVTCGLTDSDALQCWGYTQQPVEPDPRDVHVEVVEAESLVTPLSYSPADAMMGRFGGAFDAELAAASAIGGVLGVRFAPENMHAEVERVGLDEVPEGTFQQVEVAVRGACGLRTDGTVTC